ncbi:MAG TPA: iron-sulfur cluster assembly accessory protein [Dissulfurispiraceae bacterium]|nr:iron-sulfur cluster assembly accessory protein [Dissulfurispiraceae bacterium]
MFTITDKAAEKAKLVLAEEGKADWGLRVYNAGGGCCGPSFGLDIDEKASTEDEVFEKDGLKVFVDKGCLVSLTGMSLDYYDDGERAGFILSGGQAPSCGSGGGGASACGSGCSSCG